MVRVKFRYLVVNFLYPEPTTKNKSATPLPDLVQFHSPTPDGLHPGLVIRAIRDGVDELYGDYGSGMVAAGLKINYWSPSTSTLILRCPRSHYEMVWATLTYITHLPKPLLTPVVLRVIRVTGTIRKAEEEVIWRSKKIVARAREWERNGTGELPMLQSVEKAVEKERRRESEVLAAVDDGDESDEMSE